MQAVRSRSTSDRPIGVDKESQLYKQMVRYARRIHPSDARRKRIRRAWILRKQLRDTEKFWADGGASDYPGDYGMRNMREKAWIT